MNEEVNGNLKEQPSASYAVVAFDAGDLPPQYMAMIFSKWLRSLRYGAPWFKNIDSDAYYKQYHAFIELILKEPDALVKLAVLSDDHDVVLGFSVSRSHVLDYVHVHKDHRRMGIAKKLVPPGIEIISHVTQTAMTIWRENDKYKHLKFNPFLGRANVQ